MSKVDTLTRYAYEQVIRSDFTERVVRREIDADGYEWFEQGVVSFKRRERPANESVEYVVFLTVFGVVAVGAAGLLESAGVALPALVDEDRAALVADRA